MTTEERLINIKERIIRCEALLLELEKIENADAKHQPGTRKRGRWFKK